MTTTLMLTQADLQECGVTDLAVVADCLEEVFRIHSRREFTAPPSVFLKRPECPHVADRVIALAAHVGGSFDVEGMKWIASAHENTARDLPRANAVIILNDSETRLPIAIMEGALISAMRTAVVQGLACRYLARADAKTVGLVGCGRIGALTLYVLRQWFPGLDDYLVSDTDPDRAELFKRHMDKLGIRIQLTSCFEEALGSADIGIAATTAEEAYIPESCFKEGSLFMNVSLMDPTFEHVLTADKIVVDDWEQCIHSDRVLARMHRDGLLTRERIHAEFGEIVSKEKPGRTSPTERIFWNPFGLAIEDLAVAMTAYRRARDQQIGRWVDFVDTEWPALL